MPLIASGPDVDSRGSVPLCVAARSVGRYLAVVGPPPGDGDGVVGILDFLLVLGNWGPCPEPCPPSCAADLDDDCQVGIFEFLLVLGNWS